ncbi:unnamed protein product [Rotaria sp. Silwood2]|nr:unnamed protein product [Rotaria sp. Silwood2]
MVYDKNSTSKVVRKESTINSTTAKAMNTVPKIQSSPKKHCFDDGNTSTKKRQKTRIEERSTTESHTSTSRSKNASLNKDVISTNKKLIWNDQWLTFNETPKLEEIKIDARSSLKWCSNFISKTEGDALFDHLMEILNFEHTLIRRYGKLVNMYEFELSNGSLIVMLGETQLHWKHSIPKERRITTPRLNLTFRIKRDK